MRTLNRPMFNMGGPIKQGIMHGIREPHNSGGRIGLNIGGGINAARWLASQAAKTFGKVGGSYNLGNIGGGASKFYPPATIPKPGGLILVLVTVPGVVLPNIFLNAFIPLPAT